VGEGILRREVVRAVWRGGYFKQMVDNGGQEFRIIFALQDEVVSTAVSQRL